MTKLPVPYEEKGATKTSPLQLYLREISKYPLLKPEEEWALAKEHHETGSIEAAHRLITSNLRLVVKIANDFRKAQSNLLDMIQEGNYGLMQAVKKYNPYKGVKLSSYAAWWIRAYILKYLMDQKSHVRIATTAAQRKLFYNLQKETKKLLAIYDHADPKLIAENLQVTEKDVIEMQKRLYSPDLYLDTPVAHSNDEQSKKYMELMDSDENFLEEIAQEQIKHIFQEHLEEFRKTLEGRDLDFFDERLLSETPPTLQEIGEKFHISRERARQIEAKIISKLKQFVENKGIIDVS